eukprot:GFYU01010780.1.p1 GENE.GFYU01010780.1~~GFYU01010780.1.p1  ORF type:complete len:577 (-),score=112.46 GFYU01010780.1:188-1918(-)
MMDLWLVFWSGALLSAVLFGIEFWMSRRQTTKASSPKEGAASTASGKDPCKDTTKVDTDDADSKNPEFSRFQKMFLAVFLMSTFSDWIQGPYIYALYDGYGFDPADIKILFVTGYISGLVFGSMAGSLADTIGRKRSCQMFAVFYALSCMTKRVNEFWTLLAGRVLSGVATSLLFTSFEAWMVCEHHKRGFPTTKLASTFYLMTFFNGLTAIASGLIANHATTIWGYIAPFDIALGCLLIAGVVVTSTFNENYGCKKSTTFWQSVKQAVHTISSDRKMMFLGVAQSTYESSVYCFVFKWTPTLQSTTEDNTDPIPHGLIFACFMVSIMVGSAVFNFVKSKLSPAALGVMVLGCASVLLQVPALSKNLDMILCGFFAFEFCCGLFYPCFGMLRSSLVPEEVRATVSTIFRAMTNTLVIILLWKADVKDNPRAIFTVLSLSLSIGCGAMLALYWAMGAPSESDSKGSDGDGAVKSTAATTDRKSTRQAKAKDSGSECDSNRGSVDATDVDATGSAAGLRKHKGGATKAAPDSRSRSPTVAVSQMQTAAIATSIDDIDAKVAASGSAARQRNTAANASN